MDEKILTSTPINGTAANVTSQSGCSESEELTAEQKIDVLKTQVEAWQKQLDSLPKHPQSAKKRKSIGRKIAAANLNIAELKPVRYRDLSHYILDVVKENVTDFQWRKFVELAKQKKGVESDA